MRSIKEFLKDSEVIRAIMRLYEDLMDKHERPLYVAALLSPLPSIFGVQVRSKYLSRKFKKAGKSLTVASGVKFRSMENLEVGDNVGISNDVFIQALGGVKIGNNVIIGPGAKIWSVNHNVDDLERLIREQGYTHKEVIIEDDVWIAADAFVRPGTKIGKGAVIGACAVVGGEVEPYSVMAGNPARFIRSRLEEKQ